VETFRGLVVVVRRAVIVGLYIVVFTGDAGPIIIWNMIRSVFAAC